jgi:signal transduction histidine kinase
MDEMALISAEIASSQAARPPAVAFGLKLRLAALVVFVALTGALIALATLNSRSQAAELRARLSRVDFESFEIADQFRDSLRELNNIMLRYEIGGNASDWRDFRAASPRLSAWIADQAPRLQSQREKAIVLRIEYSYAAYLKVAGDLEARISSSGRAGATLADTAPLRLRSQALVDLGRALAKAHYESRNLMLEHANETLTKLRLLTLGSLCLLFVFGLALAVMVYREMIAPLRVELVESQALAARQEKLASLGALGAGVAHEIRNPLTAIKTALFIQQKSLSPGSKAHSDGKVVEREIIRLERIVDDFLKFARPTEPELASMPADLPLREVELLFSPELAKANIQVTLEPPFEALRIKADAGQIKQALINLVKNAVESIGRDGAIILRARHDRRRLARGETDVVVLEVSDSGKGIPPEVEKRIFDPFFTTKDHGTGLGLSIAARIAQNNGGALQYHTRVNHGTTFGLVLPRWVE